MIQNFKKFLEEYKAFEIGEDGNDDRFVGVPYNIVKDASREKVGSDRQRIAAQEILRRAYNKAGKPAVDLANAFDILEEGIKPISKKGDIAKFNRNISLEIPLAIEEENLVNEDKKESLYDFLHNLEVGKQEDRKVRFTNYTFYKVDENRVEVDNTRDGWVSAVILLDKYSKEDMRDEAEFLYDLEWF